MTTVEAPVADVSCGPTVDDSLPPPPERGTTAIAPRVFERLAGLAAAEDPGVVGSPPDAAADVDNDGVVLDLTLNVAYPQPVRQVTERVRRHVADRIGALTGQPVLEVNITVQDLIVPRRRRARVR